MITANKVKTELQKLGNETTKKALQKYFKTEKGEYGENDIFLIDGLRKNRNSVKYYGKKLNYGYVAQQGNHIQKLLDTLIGIVERKIK